MRQLVEETVEGYIAASVGRCKCTMRKYSITGKLFRQTSSRCMYELYMHMIMYGACVGHNVV